MSRPDGRQHIKCFVSGISIYIYASLIAIGRALRHREPINTFVYRHEDLIQHHITEEDWRAIETVTQWLGSFRSATTQMSTTSSPMLSSTHAIFRGLQSDLREILLDTHGLTPRLIVGLTDAHRKLSDYYYKFDDSPFYLWASRTSFYL